jgi:hypothetical protein
MNDNILLCNYEQPDILFLRGCFVSACNNIEDLFDERLVESCSNTKIYDTHDNKYNNIPRVFTSLDSWIKKTNVKCWSCTLTFDTIPLFVPTAISDPIAPTKTFCDMDVLGNFCSWACSSRYVHISSDSHVKWERYEMLKLLHKIMTGTRVSEIEQAPCPTIMVQYGGKSTKQEYKKILRTTDDKTLALYTIRT